MSLTALTSLYDLSFSELSDSLAALGQPPYRALQVWQGLYHSYWETFAQASTLPKALRQALSAQFALRTFTPVKQIASKDGQTLKTLLRLSDGAAVETVLMRYHRRQTLCISTQVGCAMGCSFCATGQMGFRRNLSSGEIVQQVVYYARRLHADGKAVTNVVFMGMGEPFHNYNATIHALDRLEDPAGMALSPRRCTVSTVGLIPGIRRFTQERRKENLAISLHSIDPVQREAIIPIARKHPLEALKRACLDYVHASRRRISFEWALIAGTNDTVAHARALAAWLKDFFVAGACLCHVNLIPLNPTPGFESAAPRRETVQRFAEVLQAAHIPCTVRLRRGIEINAGCGQLATQEA